MGLLAENEAEAVLGRELAHVVDAERTVALEDQRRPAGGVAGELVEGEDRGFRAIESLSWSDSEMKVPWQPSRKVVS